MKIEILIFKFDEYIKLNTIFNREMAWDEPANEEKVWIIEKMHVIFKIDGVDLIIYNCNKIIT